MDRVTIKRSLLLAWPISLQSVLTNLLSMIDVAMVSHLGDSAVGAVGLGNRFQFMVTVILMGIAWTVGVLSAQYFGADKIHKIRSTIGMACLMANIALLPIITLNFFFADKIIALGSTNPELILQGQYYLWFTIPSMTLVAIILVYENAIRALGQVKTPLLLSAAAIFFNIGLNFWLINGGLGVPALGVAGAAMATAIARLLHVVMLFSLLNRKKHLLKFRRSDLPNLINKVEIAHFLKLATPMMISFGFWSTGTFVYQIIFGRMGTRELAVMSLLTPIEGVFLALFFGMASACTIMVGQQLGANQFDKAWNYARSFSLLNPLIAIFIGCLVLLARDLVLLPFSGVPSETLQMAHAVFALIALSTWLKIINMTLAMGVLRAGGDNKICMYIDAFGMWMVSIPLTAFAAFVLKWPLIMVVLISYSEEVTKGILFSWRTYQRKWLRNLTTTNGARA